MGKNGFRPTDDTHYIEWLELELDRSLSPEEKEEYLRKGKGKIECRYDLVDYLEVEFPETESLVGNRLIIPEGFTLMGTWPKVGKSHLAMQLALNRAVGEPWLGFPTKPGRTLYVNCEIVHPMFQERFKDLLGEREKPPRETGFPATVHGMDAYINTPEGRKLTEGLIEQW